MNRYHSAWEWDDYWGWPENIPPQYQVNLQAQSIAFWTENLIGYCSCDLGLCIASHVGVNGNLSEYKKENLGDHCALAATTSKFLIDLRRGNSATNDADVVPALSQSEKESVLRNTPDSNISSAIVGLPSSPLSKGTRAALLGYLCTANTRSQLTSLPEVERRELLDLCSSGEWNTEPFHTEQVILQLSELRPPEAVRLRSVPDNYKALQKSIVDNVRTKVMSSVAKPECLPHIITIPYFSVWDDEVLCYVRAGRCSETVLAFEQSLGGEWSLAYGEDNPRLVGPLRDKILQNQMTTLDLRGTD